MTLLKKLSIGFLALFFLSAGVLHFTSTAFFEAIVPPNLPSPTLLVWLSGLVEIAVGLGLLCQNTRKAAGWLAIALLIAVFPANIFMTANPELFPRYPEWLLWTRLPMQGLLIAWIWWAAVGRAEKTQSE